MGLLAKTLGLPDHPLVIFLFLTAAGFFYFLLLAGFSYSVFFVWKKKFFHPDYEADPAAIRKSLKWSFYSIVGNAALMMPLHFLMASGYSKVYWKVSDHGWTWIIAQVILMIVITETAVYWVHRALHSDLLYDRVHAPHHAFKVTTPWAGVAFNPLDSFAQALPHHLCVLLFPVHIGVYMVFLSFLTMWAVMIHDRLSFMPWKGVNYTGHHTLHHWYSNYNFGQFFTFWDRVAGTYKDPELDTEVPASVLRAHLTRRDAEPVAAE